MQPNSLPDVTVVGLGKLGLSFAASLANAGFTVHGVDKDKTLIQTVADGIAPYPEPSLQTYLDKTGDRLSVTTDTETAVKNSKISFIFVNTPLDNGDHSLAQVRAATTEIGAALQESEEYHTVALRSTVVPEISENSVQRWLEESSGRAVGETLGLCYYPEFSAVGEVIQTLEHPPFTIIGESTPRAGDQIRAVCDELVANDSAILRTSLTTAEVAKLVNNTFRTMKISYANTIGQIAHTVGADIDDLMSSFAEDPNINPSYLEPGSRYGGPCYSRDNIVFDHFAESKGASGLLARAADEVNEFHTEWITDIIRTNTDPKETVGILGLTYKPLSYLVEESQAIHTIRELAGDYRLTATNPVSVVDLSTEDERLFELYDSPETLIDDCETAFISIPWEEYTDPALYDDVTLVDPWRLFGSAELASSVSYVPIGQ